MGLLGDCDENLLAITRTFQAGSSCIRNIRVVKQHWDFYGVFSGTKKLVVIR